MSPLTYIKMGAAALVVLAGYFLCHYYLAYQEAKGKISSLTAQIEFNKKQKEKSDQAQVELTRKLNEQQVVTTRTITKLVKVPVTVQEKCMSPVLMEALKDD